MMRFAKYQRFLLSGVAFGMLLASPAVAWAHGDGSLGGGFITGFSHPIRGWDHVLAMIAVGLWGAQLGKPQLWLLPIAFPLVMAVGASLSVMGFSLPLVEVGIAGSAIVLGLMVLCEARPPLAVSLGLVGVFALFHGHAHGTELPPGENGLMYSIGFVLGTGLLHGVGIGIGTIGQWPWGKRCLRAAGAVVLAGGVYFLSKSIGWLA